MLIADNIVAKIGAGTYAAEQRLPSEAELAEEYGAAKITVRRAVRELRAAAWSRPSTARGPSCSRPIAGPARKPGGGQVSSPAVAEEDPAVNFRCMNGGAAQVQVSRMDVPLSVQLLPRCAPARQFGTMSNHIMSYSDYSCGAAGTGRAAARPGDGRRAARPGASCASARRRPPRRGRPRRR